MKTEGTEHVQEGPGDRALFLWVRKLGRHLTYKASLVLREEWENQAYTESGALTVFPVGTPEFVVMVSFKVAQSPLP